jgi:hypothetical protein
VIGRVALAGWALGIAFDGQQRRPPFELLSLSLNFSAVAYDLL